MNLKYLTDERTTGFKSPGISECPILLNIVFRFTTLTKVFLI